MARIAYVDHSFHQKTLSTQFLPDILRKHGHEVDFFWDEEWKGGAQTPFSEVADYDIVIMFQARCQTQQRYFRKLHPNVIYIPMLDMFGIYKGARYNLAHHWEPFQGCKVLSFSSALHSIVTAFGIRSFPVRYYQPPVACRLPTDGLRGFFWIRHEDHVSWPMVRELIKKAFFLSVHLHISPDPGSPKPALPTEEEIKKFNITTSTWFESKRDFFDTLEQANVFFAPRREEGIGQSFLEAMARGQCVVAPDHGTMNEYIVHGMNGLLYTAERPAPVDFSGFVKQGESGRSSVEYGYMRWLEQEQQVVDFILTPSQVLYKGFYNHVAIWKKDSTVAVETVPPPLPLRQRIRQHPIMRKTERFWLPLWWKVKPLLCSKCTKG